jgi:hypothetical protein
MPTAYAPMADMLPSNHPEHASKAPLEVLDRYPSSERRLTCQNNQSLGVSFSNINFIYTTHRG